MSYPTLKISFNASNLKKGDLTAFLGQNDDFADYISKYRISVNILIDSLENKTIPNIEFISLPLLFLLRHVYELTTKSLITFFEYFQFIGLPYILDKKSHKISLLQDYIQKYIGNYKSPRLDSDEVQALNDYLKTSLEFSTYLEDIDPISTKLRYHKDDKIHYSFEIHKQLDTKAVIDCYYDYNSKADTLFFYLYRRASLERQ